MQQSFTLTDQASLNDLNVFLDRAMRVEDGAVRLIGAGGVLAVYVAVLYPVGLRDETPTVLALRTFALSDQESFDLVVPIRSLLARVERSREKQDNTVGLPLQVHTATWAGISPPRGGWRETVPVADTLLTQVASAGIAEIARTIPEAVGAELVRRVRAEVWSRAIPGVEHVPSGAAFAAISLGFLGQDQLLLYETGSWIRLSTSRGHVLIRQKAWTLTR